MLMRQKYSKSKFRNINQLFNRTGLRSPGHNMSSLTKQKIMLLLNDIYLKSKENKVFKPASICAHYHVGHQLCTVLLKHEYIKFIDRGKYLYQGKPIDEKLIDEVYSLYSKYKSDQKKEYNSRPKNITDSTKSNLFNNINSLEEKINQLYERSKQLDQRITQLNSYVMDMILNAPAKDKSFLHRIFNK